MTLEEDTRPQTSGESGAFWEPCVLGVDGRCSRWSHRHEGEGRSPNDRAPSGNIVCWCCRREVIERDPDPWDGRLDGYCYECALTRCDAYPGACGTPHFGRQR